MIIGLDASELAQRIGRGDLSAAEVTEAHIARIQETNPQLNAVVIPLFDEARSQAAAADEALQRGDDVGPLHGVPVTIKEQFTVAGTQTTIGATAKIGNVSHNEGPLVTKLRDSGAIILGKTNIIQTLAGWESVNPVYGRSSNPWNLDRTPGGSSGGEAAIVAAGGSALGLGGDFGGSTRVPAHFCGVHGLKPTSRRLSNADFPPGLLGNGQELFVPQPGPIARSVGDVKLAMRLFAETSMQPTPDLAPPVPWTDPEETQVAGLRIGMYTDNGDFPVAPPIRRAVEDAAAALETMGAVVEPVAPPDPDEGIRLFLGAASAGGIGDYMRLLEGEKPIPQVAGMIRAGKIPAPMRPVVAKLMESRGQHQVARQVRSMGAGSTDKYFELVEDRNRYQAAFTRSLDDGRFDAVICPPVALPAFTHGASEHLFAAVAYAYIYNVLGAPAGVVSITRVREGEDTAREVTKDMTDITAAEVEVGSVGLPVGVQVVARHWDDHIVLAVMAALEQHFRQQPDYPRLPME
ncbi:MAG: amidase family protein [Acidimicrobiia bacterium]|nr:amidase family protein [Acidimicrobiia bacterium]